MHATQLGATGGARAMGAFSTAGARRLRAFVHYSSSHNRASLNDRMFVQSIFHNVWTEDRKQENLRKNFVVGLRETRTHQEMR